MTIKAINAIMTERIEDQPCGQRDCDSSAFVLRHWRSVARVGKSVIQHKRKKPNLHPELYQRDVQQVECGHPIVSCTRSLHVPLTAETKDPVNEGLLMKTVPKDATLINAARPGRVHKARDT